MKKISMETILGVLLFAGLGLLFTRGIQKTAGDIQITHEYDLIKKVRGLVGKIKRK